MALKDILNATVGGQTGAAASGADNVAGGNLLAGAFGKVVPKAAGAALGVSTGGAAQLALGGIQRIAGAIKQKKANSMFPEGEDPELRALATSYSRRKRAFQTGTALESQKAQIRSMGRAGINAAFRAGGGSAGLNKMAQLIQQGMTGLQDEALKGEMAYAQQEGDIIKQLAQTKLEKRLLRYNQAQADAKKLSTQANRNLGSAFARVMNIPQPQNVGSVPSLPQTTTEEAQ